MIETLTVITVSVLLLIFFRPGKTPPLDNPLVIERSGKYRIILAPKLNLAQSFIEAIAKRIESLLVNNDHSNAVKYYSVRDSNISKRGNEEYLLAVIFRNGMLYFQAGWPLSNNPSNHLDTIQVQTWGISVTDKRDETLENNIGNAVRDVANERVIYVTQLNG